MNCKKVTETIVAWLKEKLEEAGLRGFIVGVSGGVDSGTVSTLCAMTGKPTIILGLPIQNRIIRADQHMANLRERFSTNVYTSSIDLSEAAKVLIATCSKNLAGLPEPDDSLAEVNTRSRIRMVSLYYMANRYRHLVVGTGNKIEDYGVGFFTKYGDGGVDISPIGDLIKTEVRELASYLNVIESIRNAEPNDGLWEDGRSDEQQLGASYSQLEIAMRFCDTKKIATIAQYEQGLEKISEIPEIILYNYLRRHETNKHKMEMPPVCLIDKQLKDS